jgi:hypothetical protein
LDPEELLHLLEIGALEFVSVDENNEDVYRFTKNAKKLVPELYQEHMQEFSNVVFSLWTKNMLDVVFDEEGEPLISINEDSSDLKKIEQLDLDEKEVLFEIVSSWEEKEGRWYND